MAHVVFISHSNEDTPIADAACATLEHHGIRCWMAPRDIQPGMIWAEAIIDAIGKSRVMLLIFSRHSNNSQQVLREVQCAVDEGVAIFPFRIADTPASQAMRYFIGVPHWMDALTPPMEERLGEMAEKIKTLLVQMGAASAITPVAEEPTNGIAHEFAPPDMAADHDSTWRAGIFSELPLTVTAHVGRSRFMRLLDESLYDPSTNIVVIHARGGEGKTSLIKHWLESLRDRPMSADIKDGFAYSFYNQGQERGQTSADEFFERIADRFSARSQPGGFRYRSRGQRLADAVRRGKNLIILDGLEPLQHPPGEKDGRLRDEDLATFLRELAFQNSGLCVLTTRRAVAELRGTSGVKTVRLTRMTLREGCILLQQLGVRAPNEELSRFVSHYDGHALSLVVLGHYTRRRYGGDLSAFSVSDQRRLLSGNDDSSHLRNVLESVVEWIEAEGDAVAHTAIAILRILSLFDRPARPELLRSLRRERLRGLTDSLFAHQEDAGVDDGNDLAQATSLTDDDWDRAIDRLRSVDMLNTLLDDGDGEEKLDCHPLVRSYFSNELAERFAEQARQAHRMIMTDIKEAAVAVERRMVGRVEGLLSAQSGNTRRLPHATKAYKSERESLFLWYRAVHHGCRAGDVVKTLHEIYQKTIQRNSKFYAIGRHGLLSEDLEALSHFFTREWTQPTSQLSTRDQVYVLNQVGVILWPLGQFEMAAKALEQGVEVACAAGQKHVASIVAGNLCELRMRVGDVQQAEVDAIVAGDLAKETGNCFCRVNAVMRRAGVRHHSGATDEAMQLYQEAAELKQKGRFRRPELYVSRWPTVEELLLDMGRADEAIARLRERERLSPAEFLNDFDSTLQKLRLGRAYVIKAERQRCAAAAERAEEYLHQARTMLTIHENPIKERVAEVLLYDAVRERVVGHDLGKVEERLNEAESYAATYYPPLVIRIHLERARLLVAWGKNADALSQVRKANTLIQETGFRILEKVAKEVADEVAQEAKGG